MITPNEEIKNQINDSQTTLKQEFRSLTEDLVKDICKIGIENKALKQELIALRVKLKKLERESKKYKFIVYNPEENEKWG